MIIDTHAHLTDPRFNDDLEAVLRRAIETGVGRIVVVGDAIASSLAGLELARRHPGLLSATVGIHPHHAREFDAASIAQLRTAAGDEMCVAIGEIGLDYHYNFSPGAAQREAFAAQLDLARELDLPTVIHCRDAFDDLFEILRNHPPAAAGSVLHCFTGSRDRARRALDSGLFLGAGGMITFEKSVELRQAIAAAPLESLLLETDAPYLAPVPHRGRRNEPAYAADVAAFLAGQRSLPLQQIARTTTVNATRLFRLRQ